MPKAEVLCIDVTAIRNSHPRRWMLFAMLAESRMRLSRAVEGPAHPTASIIRDFIVQDVIPVLGKPDVVHLDRSDPCMQVQLDDLGIRKVFPHPGRPRPTGRIEIAMREEERRYV